MDQSSERQCFNFAWSDQGGRKFKLALGERTLLMGVLNLTPDSFYDGGRYQEPELAQERALALEAEGADIIDIGGESSRPGADPVDEREELKRVLPVIERLQEVLRIPISIDTYKAAVARAALASGAQIINDISALRFDPGMPAVAAEYSGPVIMMHMKGAPRNMQSAPEYRDVVVEVKNFLRQRMEEAGTLGIARERIILDPGIGFGKTWRHNLQLLAALDVLAELGRPLLVGPSRKSFLGVILGQPATERLWGTAGAAAAAAFRGAHIIRVHDVAQMKDVLRVIDAVSNEKERRACSER